MKSFRRRIPAIPTLFFIGALAACKPESAPPASTPAPAAASVPGPVEGTRITEAYG